MTPIRLSSILGCMARSKSSRTIRARDLSTSIATQVRPFRAITQLPVPADFQGLPGADRRRFHPERRRMLRPLVHANRPDARLVRAFPFARLQIVDPRRALLCARRKERRQVLFARRTLGRGGAGRRTPLTKITCRRGGR